MKRSIVRDEMRIDGIIVREVANAPCCILSEHSHEELTVGILLEGTITERRGAEVRTQLPGDVFVRRTGVAHANQLSVAGAKSIFLELEPDDRRAEALSRSDRMVCDDLRQAGQRFVRAFVGRAGGRDASLRKGIAEIVERALAVRRRPVPTWLDAAREAIASRSHGPLRFQDLASDLRVHPVHFAQAFRAHFGETPGDFLRAHRVFDAMALAHRGVPLADAASANGFADQSHMTRVVRAARGAPPARLLREASLLVRGDGSRATIA